MLLFLGISKFFLYLVPFSVLIISRSTLFPFIVGKAVFLRFIVELSLFFFVLYLVWERPELERLKKKIIDTDYSFILRSKIFWAVTAFVALFAIAGIFGVDPRISFWSNFERGEGIFQVFHYYLFFLLLLFVFRKEDDWRRLFLFSIFAGIGVTLYGLLQLWGVEGVVSSGQGRIQGTLGNPAYVGAYLMFGMFYVAQLLLQEKRRFLQLSLFLVFGFFIVGFLFAQTRGSLLVLLAGLGLSFLYLVWKAPSKRFRHVSLGILGFLIVVAGLIFALRHKPFIQNLPFARIFDIDLQGSGAHSRFWTWKSAFKGFLDRPLLGWGPENFSRAFDKYFDVRHFISPNASGQQLWFDRAHNNVLEYLVQTGILGLLAYLSIFIAVYWILFKKSLNERYEEALRPLIKNALMIFMPTAYFVQSLVLFDVLPIFLNLFLFLAYAVHVLEGNKSVDIKKV